MSKAIFSEIKADQLVALLEHSIQQRMITGKMITILLIGNHGIGKTSIPEQVCMNHVFGNGPWAFGMCPLAEISESGDIAGLPILGEDDSGNKITTTARADFLPDPEDTRPGIFLVDDFNRAMPHILQAFMRLSMSGEYRGWRMPRNQILVLTGNPEDSKYNTSATDAAQTDRMYRVQMVFDVKSWLDWASAVTERSINRITDAKSGKITTETIEDARIDSRVVGIVMKTYADKMQMSSFPWGTPRETERLSNIIYGTDDRTAIRIAEQLNKEFAAQLHGYIEFRKELPSISELFGMSPEEIDKIMKGCSRSQKMVLVYEIALHFVETRGGKHKEEKALAEKLAIILASIHLPNDMLAGIVSILKEKWSVLLGRLTNQSMIAITRKLGNVT